MASWAASNVVIVDRTRSIAANLVITALGEQVIVKAGPWICCIDSIEKILGWARNGYR